MSNTPETDYQSLSQRGHHLASTPARADFDLFMAAAQDPYHPEQNPQGKFPLNVAENSPMIPLIQAQFQDILSQGNMPEWVFKYTDTAGHPEVRATVARFMSEHLCHCPIDPGHLAFGAGASAIIEVSSFVLANSGDVVVIPAPSYPMYTNDLGVKSGLERYNLQTHYHLTEHGTAGPITPTILDQTWAELETQGKQFKILLITSPDNPTGCVYTPEQLRALAQWCIQHRVHLVVNEIYGLSPILGAEVPTQSFGPIMAELQSDYLHLWYALSKDFAMSGLRFGIVHSLNEAFLKGFASANIPHLVSNLTQWVVGEMFQREAFIESYIEANQKSLSDSYQVVAHALDQIGVPYLPSQGSLFVWADLSQFLGEDSEAGQDALWQDIFHQTGVLLTPGTGFGHQKKGLFRIVFTAVPADHLAVAMQRLADYLKQT